MRIKSDYKVRQIADENVVIMQGIAGADMTQIITLNDSALLLWNSLQGIDFTIEDAVYVLCANYDVEPGVALGDVKSWVARLQECNLVE
ncbi:MAG: PqqD family protein [Alistipes sp.]|nr:PqqD family protein [Alistipes sp.]